MTTAVAGAPRTMVGVTAALDAVALRIDEAGVRPDQLDVFRTSPRHPEVTVQFRADEQDGFEALAALFPDVERRDYTHATVEWLVARTHLRDGTPVVIVAPLSVTP